MALGIHQSWLLPLLLAYVMPSWGVLKRYANQRDELTLSSLKAEGVATAAPAFARDIATQLGVSWLGGELSLNAMLAVRFPGRCKLELTSPDSMQVIGVSVSQGKVRSDKESRPALEALVEHACALLAMKSTEEGATRETLMRQLSAHKIDARQVSLARFEGTVSYVLGSRDEGQPQLWVYKDSFLPSRLRVTDKDGTAWDIRLVDYGSQATGEVWPRVMEVYKGQELQLRVMLLSAQPKADLSAVKF